MGRDVLGRVDQMQKSRVRRVGSGRKRGDCAKLAEMLARYTKCAQNMRSAEDLELQQGHTGSNGRGVCADGISLTTCRSTVMQ